MAKNTEGMQRIGSLVPATSVAVPSVRTEDVTNKEFALSSWEFRVSEKGGDFVVMQAHDMVTQKAVEITAWDKAIIAQLANIPEGTPMPLLVKVVKFGRFHALE